MIAPCPSADDIASLLEGHAAAGLSQGILEHVDHCQPCRMLLANALRTPGAAPHAPNAGTSLQTFSVGEFVDSRYRIRRFIARGGMGEVYDAWDTQLHEAVALKTIACTGLDNAKLFDQLRAEVQLARRVTHKNVCRILEFGLHSRENRRTRETMPYFTMELLDGETLRQLILRRGALEEVEILPLILQVLDGLSAVHAAGIVHRDLKPDNVFILRPDPSTTRVVVMDFGLARSLTRSNSPWSSNNTSPVGTPAYMAPEQATGETATTAWDIYAVGVILFELLTGTLPFKGDSALALALARLHRRAPLVSSINPRSGTTFERIVMRCLERDPARRFATLDELQQALSTATMPRWSPVRRPASIALLMLASVGLVAFALRPTGYHLGREQLAPPASVARALPPHIPISSLVAAAKMPTHVETARRFAASSTAVDAPSEGSGSNIARVTKSKLALNSSKGKSNRTDDERRRTPAIASTTQLHTAPPSNVAAAAGQLQVNASRHSDDELVIPSFVGASSKQHNRADP